MTQDGKLTLAAGERAAISRRDFLQGAAAAGAGLALGGVTFAQEDAPAPGSAPAGGDDEIVIGLIGAGNQGLQSLIQGCLKIPGVRFAAIADIWPYNANRAGNYLKASKQPVNVYADYREMLDKEKGLDAVLIATPDWVHADQTVDCLQAGKHVYCEKEMSHTLEGARRMVVAARDTGKLLQIGHQRRSNPRYLHALKLIYNDRVLGRITHFSGQWNRAVQDELGWPKGSEMDEATLKTFGYESMNEFRNWRWYKRYSGGPISDLGSHQIDVFSWFLKSLPASVFAAGGADYYAGREWYDNIMTIYEYPTEAGLVRGSYQVLYTTSHGGFYETFMGDEGSLVISEDSRKGFFFREFGAKTRDWEEKSEMTETTDGEAITLKIGETLSPDGTPDPEAQALLAESQKPVHQLHLENFFDAMRLGTPLTCPPELGYETCVAVLKANEALEKGCRLEFKPEDFKA